MARSWFQRRFIATFCLLLAPAAAMADVVGSSSVDILAAPPASVQLNALTSNTMIFLFQEVSSFVLPTALYVDTTQQGTYNYKNLPPGGILPAGTVVNSYLMHTDPTDPGFGLTKYAGNITFTGGEQILGLMMLSSTLNLPASDALDAPGTVYPPPALNWGMEFDPFYGPIEGDSITWAGSQIFWNSGTGGGHDTGGEDDVRIITFQTPVPEPGLFFVIGGILMVLLVRRFGRVRFNV